jgi:hypothetical protein
MIRIAEDIGEVETALADESFRIDCEKAARTEVENVAVMEVSMQDGEVARRLEKMPPCAGAAGARALNQSASFTSSGKGCERGACRRAATAQMMLVASSSMPLRAISASEAAPPARSRSKASSSCAMICAALSPSHHSIRLPPRRSSSASAIFSIMAMPSRRTGSNLLEGVASGAPSGSRFQR